ncbi:ribosomal protein L49/IMG2 [Scleroderma yunnanense]
MLPALFRRSFSSLQATASSGQFFVRRNSRGSLPVYTDIRNGRTRHLILIRNIQGQTQALANELRSSLFKPDSPEAAKLRVRVHAQRHVVISGGRWKTDVMAWLADKGF